MFSGPRETAREQANAGDEEPSLCAGDGSLEVLGQAAVPAEPGKSAFHHPAPWLGLEAADALGAGDNLDRPAAKRGDRIAQLVAAVDAIGSVECARRLRRRAMLRDALLRSAPQHEVKQYLRLASP